MFHKFFPKRLVESINERSFNETRKCKRKKNWEIYHLTGLHNSTLIALVHISRYGILCMWQGLMRQYWAILFHNFEVCIEVNMQTVVIINDGVRSVS
jgi:hypothetical protein